MPRSVPPSACWGSSTSGRRARYWAMSWPMSITATSSSRAWPVPWQA
jgi:hypothetical protein